MKKYSTEPFLVIIFFPSLFYLTGSFISLSFNPENWEHGLRFGFSIALIICLIFSLYVWWISFCIRES
jgi:hypothetical protein